MRKATKVMTKRPARWLGACALLLAGTMGHAADTPPAAPVAAATPPTAEQVGHLPFMESPQLSPDGTRVAAQIALGGQLRLAIIPRGDTAHLKLIYPGPADINGWSWVNNDWLVVTVGQSSAIWAATLVPSGESCGDSMKGRWPNCSAVGGVAAATRAAGGVSAAWPMGSASNRAHAPNHRAGRFVITFVAFLMPGYARAGTW